MQTKRFSPRNVKNCLRLYCPRADPITRKTFCLFAAARGNLSLRLAVEATLRPRLSLHSRALIACSALCVFFSARAMRCWQSSEPEIFEPLKSDDRTHTAAGRTQKHEIPRQGFEAVISDRVSTFKHFLFYLCMIRRRGCGLTARLYEGVNESKNGRWDAQKRDEQEEGARWAARDHMEHGSISIEADFTFHLARRCFVLWLDERSIALILISRSRASDASEKDVAKRSVIALKELLLPSRGGWWIANFPLPRDALCSRLLWFLRQTRASSRGCAGAALKSFN